MSRIKDFGQRNPSKEDCIIFDGENGTFKISLGDIGGVFDVKGVAGLHNSIYRGADLKKRFGIDDDKAIADEVQKRIADGSFNDLFVGDYWSATINSTYGTETVEIVLAGFDVYLNSIPEYLSSEDDYSIIKRHHAVCVTRKQLAQTQQMNSSSTTSGGYSGSAMFKTVLPAYAIGFQAALNNHIIELCDSVTTSVDTSAQNANHPALTGAADGWDYSTDYRMHLTLLTEREVYGAPAFSSSAYDVGFETSQLPLFRLDPSAKITGSWYWLKDVASSSDFCSVNGSGVVDCNGATNSDGVRPRFLIG